MERKPTVIDKVDGEVRRMNVMKMRELMLLLPSILLVACDDGGKDPRKALPCYTVGVAYPQVGTVVEWREWVGRLDADVMAGVVPRVDGYVSERFFINGQSVKQGDKLYQLDDSLYAEALNEALQQQEAAAANAREAQQNVDYYRPLVEQGAVSRQTFTEAERKAEAANAALEAAKAAVAQARTDLGYCTLYAPLSGIAGFAKADVGSYVSPTSGEMVTISKIDPMRVLFSISEQDWLEQGGENGSLRPGAEVELLLPTGDEYAHKARITGVDNEVSAQLGTLMMDAVVPNEGVLLRPGMYVTVRAAVGREENQLLVPPEAVLSQQGKNFLLVLEEENKITPVLVLTGVTQDGLVAVRGDLTPQMRIVVSGTQQAMMAAEGRARLKTVTQSEGHGR